MIDSHCHLDLEPLRSILARILDEAANEGVQGFVVPGVHPDGWGGISALSAADPRIMPAYGIHPMHAGCASAEVLERLLALSAHGVAIGEIGLDPAYPVSLEQQEKVFREQLRIAVTRGLPVLVHCRKAFQRVAKILREEQAEQVGGIMHAFSGSLEMAQEFTTLGFAISVSGTVTWHNAVKPLRVARELPLEHLVLETDAPDMTPERYRGRFNRPAWIVETALRVAAVRGMSLGEVARITSGNVRRVLRL
ncbi:MAG: TatD family hydrolase [Desulfuromonadaceae bacterium]|nr:TatD family hydrolase [Desulfuromonadaceae bacterium]MDD2849842.1 TatD family hydrolase [Desulfuromonadaceae bacterium]MDD4131613.1 TatD family hydrolase [Desulfuromonadaceae bacterium]